MDVRALLEQRLTAILPDGVELVPENVEAAPAADAVWLRIHDRPGRAWAVDRLRRRLGTFRMELNAPRNAGPGPAETLARSIAREMEQRTLGAPGLVVWPGTTQHEPAETGGTWFRLPLELPYLVTEMEETATP